ncbi:MAG TPA: hypothetical protein VK916_02275 [Gillisia sp.]|nr:hypothetical protein [Gillisia sp.]
MKKLFLTGLVLTSLTFTSCNSDDDTALEQLATCTDGIQNGLETGIDCGGPCAACVGEPAGVDEDLSGIITEDLTLTKDIIWELNGKVVVGNGVTLTIEPGTIIKGRTGTGSLASALIVARGGMIDARGTATQPIIFTSINDNIQVGQKAGTNLDEDDRGLWGGVIILGYAPSSFEGDSQEAQIEGIPADDEFGRYGGDDPEDNSGYFQYVSIRHGGALIGSGNEINGLTMGGVGNGTLIDHVEVVGNVDDAFEWFGGTVNSSNLVAYAHGDDGLDIDQSYSGTIIKGRTGTGSLASALIVARGGMIDARGTATQPIIFTSINDNIQVGQKAGTNLDKDDRGLWGGVLILGNAPSSFEGDSQEAQIEGIPADDEFGRYGGDDPEDNSGYFQYVSIRHGGALIGSGNEINGLTMGGVGNGTLIDHVEVVGNVDDAFEWFGGTVNSSNLVAYAHGDDGLDIDQSYSGTITNALVIQGNISDHALEIDGPEGTFEDSFMIDGLTIIGDATAPAGEIADFRDGARGTVKNVFIKGFSAAQDVELDDAGTAANYTNGDLKFLAWEIVLPEGVTNVADIFNDTTNSTTLKADSATFATSIEEGSKTVGADLTVFDWTFAKSRGAF